MYLSYDGIVFDMLLLESWVREPVMSSDGCDFLFFHHQIDVIVAVNNAVNPATRFPRQRDLTDPVKTTIAKPHATVGVPATVGGKIVNESPNKSDHAVAAAVIAKVIAPLVLPGQDTIPPMPPQPASQDKKYPAWLGYFPTTPFTPTLQQNQGPVSQPTGDVAVRTSVAAITSVIIPSAINTTDPASVRELGKTTPKPVSAGFELNPTPVLPPPPRKPKSTSVRIGQTNTSGFEEAVKGVKGVVVQKATAFREEMKHITTKAIENSPVGMVAEGLGLADKDDFKSIADKAFSIHDRIARTVSPIYEIVVPKDPVPSASDSITKILTDEVKKLQGLFGGLDVIGEAAPILIAKPPPKKRALDADPPPDPRKNGIFRNTLPITDIELRERLSRPRRELKVWINSGPNGDPEFLLAQPFPGAVTDAKHGPTCRIMNMGQIVGNVTGVLRLQFECWEAPIPGYHPELQAKGVTAGVADMLKNTPPLLSNRWSMRQVPDPTSWLNTTVIEGRAVFRLDVLHSRHWTPDQLRPFFMAPIPFGYVRRPPEVVVSSGGDEVTYTIVDEQQMMNNPAGLQWGVHNVIAKQTFQFNSPIDYARAPFARAGLINTIPGMGLTQREQVV